MWFYRENLIAVTGNFNFCFVQFEKEWQYWLKLCSKNTSMEGGIVYLYLCCSFQIFAQSQSLGQLLLTRDPLVEYDIRGRVCSILQGRPTDQQQKQRSRRHRTGCGNILHRWQSIARIWRYNSFFSRLSSIPISYGGQEEFLFCDRIFMCWHGVFFY